MQQSQWRNRLEGELRRQALPATYRQRLLQELNDHQLDMETHQMSMDALAAGSVETRLGEPRAIAAQAAKVYRRNFVQRRPLICFVVGPLVGFPVALIGAMAVGFPLTAWILGAIGIDLDSYLADPAVLNLAIHTLAWCLRLIPFAAAAWFFVYLARRSKQDYRWSLVAVLLVTLIAASFNAQVVDKIGTNQGNFSVGLSLPITSPLAYLQVAAPLGIALFAFLRRNDHSPAQLAN
jgi:hypothetical protein